MECDKIKKIKIDILVIVGLINAIILPPETCLIMEGSVIYSAWFAKGELGYILGEKATQ